MCRSHTYIYTKVRTLALSLNIHLPLYTLLKNWSSSRSSSFLPPKNLTSRRFSPLLVPSYCLGAPSRYTTQTNISSWSPSTSWVTIQTNAAIPSIPPIKTKWIVGSAVSPSLKRHLKYQFTLTAMSVCQMEYRLEKRNARHAGARGRCS